MIKTSQIQMANKTSIKLHKIRQNLKIVLRDWSRPKNNKKRCPMKTIIFMEIRNRQAKRRKEEGKATKEILLRPHNQKTHQKASIKLWINQMITTNSNKINVKRELHQKASLSSLILIEHQSETDSESELKINDFLKLPSCFCKTMGFISPFPDKAYFLFTC